jgi:hypothetical protein
MRYSGVEFHLSLKTAAMKNTTYITFLLLLFLGMQVRAQDTPKEFRFTIKTNPLAAMGGPLYVAFVPISGEYKVLFEVKTTRKQSIETGLSFLGPSLFLNIDEISNSEETVSGVNTSGFRVQLAYKFFLTSDEAPRGFYVGPHVSYAKASIVNKDNTDDEFTAVKLNMNVLLGYQLITKGGFALNLFTGLGFKLRDYDVPEESAFDFDYGNKAVPNVTMGLSFGIAF